MEQVERMARVLQSLHGTPFMYWSEYTLIESASTSLTPVTPREWACCGLIVAAPALGASQERGVQLIDPTYVEFATGPPLPDVYTTRAPSGEIATSG